ncbi:MAG TPA: hypothetical protein VMT16_03015, partial [Thermoanaerobaculia bacterium]|nr:hypothetical protein [Thermoanaerobaculia bacterium]
LRAGAEVFGYVGMLCDGSGARQGIQWAVEATALDQVQGGEAALAAAGFDASGDLAAVTGRANSAEVTLYTLQATGLQVLGAADASQAHRLVTPELDAARRANHQDPLAALALDTGGRALLERNDYLTALGGIAQDLAHFYSLGFTPTARRAGRVSTVRVEVDRPGVRLRYRTRFQFRTRDEEAAAQARAALLLDVVDNPLALALSADRGDTGQEPTGGGWRLRLTIPTAGLSCLDEAGSRSCLITVFVGAQRRDGRLTDVRSRAIPVALPAASDAGRPAANYVYEVAMPVKTPLHRIVAVVRDEMSGLLSTAITTVGAPSGAQREKSE